METNGSKEIKANIQKIMGNNLKKLRRDFDLTQEDLSEIIGIGISTISRIERGIVSLSLNHVAKLCDKYNIEPNRFFESSDSPELLNNNMQVLMRDTGAFQNEDQVEELYNEIRSFLSYINYKLENIKDKKG